MKRNSYFFRLLTALLAALLMPGMSAAQAGGKVIQRPDQTFTVGVYRTAGVERMPGTEIKEFKNDPQNIVWAYMTGAIAGDKVGQATLELVEYDTDTDTTYKSRIHVTVVPMDRELDWGKCVVPLEGTYAVGDTFQLVIPCTRNGQPVPIIYSSNHPEVASVDSNGLVRMLSPGTVQITYRAADSVDAFSSTFNVYEGDPAERDMVWRTMYDPADPGERLLMYKSPSTDSGVVFRLAPFATMAGGFHVLKKDDTWCKVSYQGVTGYIKTEELYAEYLSGKQTRTITTPCVMYTQAPNIGTVSLYASAQNRSTAIKKYPNGVAVTVVEIAETWANGGGVAKVQVEDMTGYMLIGQLSAIRLNGTADSAASAGTAGTGASAVMVVRTGNADPLKLRARASQDARILGKYKNGTLVSVHEKASGWARVTVNGQEGYMMLKFLADAATAQAEAKPQPEQAAQPAKESPAAAPARGTATVTHPNGTFVNLRSGPHTDYKVLVQVPHGAQVTILSQDQYWSRIQYGDTVGYMVSRYLK